MALYGILGREFRARKNTADKKSIPATVPSITHMFWIRASYLNLIMLHEVRALRDTFTEAFSLLIGKEQGSSYDTY